MKSSSEEAVREAKIKIDHEESYARDGSDDTLERLLRQDAEFVGDAQSLREYADFLQTAHKDLSQARLLYTRALQLEPANVRAHSNLGRLAHEGGELAVAERHYRAALLLDPLDLDTLSYSAVLAQAQNDLERADECYMQALAVAPYHAACHSNYATLLLERAARRHLPAPNAHAEKCTPKGSDTAEKSGHMERAEWHLEQVNPICALVKQVNRPLSLFLCFTSAQVVYLLY
jgi:tetratricopeptide (TPR) repeat protein